MIKTANSWFSVPQPLIQQRNILLRDRPFNAPVVVLGGRIWRWNFCNSWWTQKGSYNEPIARKNRITAFLFIKPKTWMSKREKPKTAVDTETEKQGFWVQKPKNQSQKWPKPQNPMSPSVLLLYCNWLCFFLGKGSNLNSLLTVHLLLSALFSLSRKHKTDFHMKLNKIKK